MMDLEIQCLFLYHSQTKNHIYIFKWLGKIKNFHGLYRLYKIQISMPIGKVLLVPSHTHSFMYCQWLLLFYKSRAV